MELEEGWMLGNYKKDKSGTESVGGPAIGGSFGLNQFFVMSLSVLCGVGLASLTLNKVGI